MLSRIIGRIDVPSTSSVGYITHAATGLEIATAINISLAVMMIDARTVTDVTMMVADRGIMIAGATTVAINRHSTVHMGAAALRERGRAIARPSPFLDRVNESHRSILIFRLARMYLFLRAGPGIRTLIHR